MADKALAGKVAIITGSGKNIGKARYNPLSNGYNSIRGRHGRSAKNAP